MDLIGEVTPDPRRHPLLSQLQGDFRERCQPSHADEQGHQPEALVDLIAAENLHTRDLISKARSNQGAHHASANGHQSQIHQAR